MKKITYLYLTDCPFCDMANAAIKELTAENPAYAEIEMERIEEEENPDLVEDLDYYYVPCFYIGDEKVFEAYYMIPYEEVRAGVKKTFDAALQ